MSWTPIPYSGCVFRTELPSGMSLGWGRCIESNIPKEVPKMSCGKCGKKAKKKAAKKK